LLERNEKIMVGHVFQESPGKSLDHQWSLGDEETEKLRKLIQFMAREKKRLGPRPSNFSWKSTSPAQFKALNH
jgi:hypothetical protein